MWKEIKKIWFDTTTNCATGKYGMKRLQVLLATFMGVILSTPHFIELHIYPVQSFNIIPPPDWLIYAWLAIGFGFAGLNEYGKIQARKEMSENTTNENENG